jgi:hypothetical protein
VSEHATTNPSRVNPKPRERGAAFGHVAHERRLKSNEGSQGFVGTGATITEVTIQTNPSPLNQYPGIVYGPDGLHAYNAGGVETLFISAADGSVTVEGTGAITGGVIQTSTTPPMVIMDSSGLRSYGAGGSLSFNLSGDDGSLTVYGGTITAPVIQTSTGSPVMYFDPHGLHAYNSTGLKTIDLTDTGNFTLVHQNSVIAATASGVTISNVVSGLTGARVTIDATGIKGYNSSGTQEFFLDATSGLIQATGLVQAQPGSTVPWQTTNFFVGGGNLVSNSSAEDPTTSTQILYMSTGSGITGGTFALQYSGGTVSAAIAYNAAASAVQTALNAAGVLPAGVTATCSGGPLPSTPVTITLAGFSTPAPSILTVTSSSLVGGSAAVGGVPTNWSAPVSATTYAAMVKSDGPVAYWRLDETTGTTAFDQMGSFPATYTGTFTLGQPGALAGDASVLIGNTAGSSAKATGFTPFVVGSSRTFEGWAYATSNPANALFGADVGGTNGAPSLWFDTASTLGFYPDNLHEAQWANVWPGINQWVHWAITYNDTTKVAELFINGVSQGQQTIAAGYQTGDGNFMAGGWEGAGGFPGRIDEYAVYNSILPASRIQAHANARGLFDVIDFIQFSQAFHGGNVFRLTGQTAGGTVSLSQTLGPFGWVPGTTVYTLSSYFRPTTTVRNASVQINWLDSSLNIVSQSTVTTATEVSGQWTRLVATATVPAAATRQQIAITGSPTAGSFTLTYSGQTTATLPYNATAAQVMSALQALTAVGTNGVAFVTGGPLPGAPVYVSFISPPANPVVALTATNSLTGGTSPQVSIQNSPALYAQIVPSVSNTSPAEVHYVDAIQFECGDAPTAYGPRPDEIVANTIQANMINVGQLSAISANLGTITAGSLSAVTITGSTVQTSTANPRLVLNSSAFFATNSSGTSLVQIDTSDGLLLTGGKVTINAVTWGRSSVGGDTIGQIYTYVSTNDTGYDSVVSIISGQGTGGGAGGGYAGINIEYVPQGSNTTSGYYSGITLFGLGPGSSNQIPTTNLIDGNGASSFMQVGKPTTSTTPWSAKSARTGFRGQYSAAVLLSAGAITSVTVTDSSLALGSGRQAFWTVMGYLSGTNMETVGWSVSSNTASSVTLTFYNNGAAGSAGGTFYFYILYADSTY